MNDEILKIKPKKLRGDDDAHLFTLRLKKEMYDRVEELVKETGYSRNELLNILLKFALDNCEVEK